MNFAYGKDDVINVPELGSNECCVAMVQPLNDLASIGLYDIQFRGEHYHDYLPLSENTLQTFILSNIRGRYKRLPPPKPGEAPATTLEITDEEVKMPKWSLTVLTSTTSWENEDKEWKWTSWKQLVTITPLFQEEFQVVARAETYYFLTKSGKVYQSKKPEKGKERTMEAALDRQGATRRRLPHRCRHGSHLRLHQEPEAGREERLLRASRPAQAADL